MKTHQAFLILIVIIKVSANASPKFHTLSQSSITHIRKSLFDDPSSEIKKLDTAGRSRTTNEATIMRLTDSQISELQTNFNTSFNDAEIKMSFNESKLEEQMSGENSNETNPVHKNISGRSKNNNEPTSTIHVWSSNSLTKEQWEKIQKNVEENKDLLNHDSEDVKTDFEKYDNRTSKTVDGRNEKRNVKENVSEEPKYYSFSKTEWEELKQNLYKNQVDEDEKILKINETSNNKKHQGRGRSEKNESPTLKGLGLWNSYALKPSEWNQLKQNIHDNESNMNVTANNIGEIGRGRSNEMDSKSNGHNNNSSAKDNINVVIVKPITGEKLYTLKKHVEWDRLLEGISSKNLNATNEGNDGITKVDYNEGYTTQGYIQINEKMQLGRKRHRNKNLEGRRIMQSQMLSDDDDFLFLFNTETENNSSIGEKQNNFDTNETSTIAIQENNFKVQNTNVSDVKQIPVNLFTDLEIDISTNVPIVSESDLFTNSDIVIDITNNVPILSGSDLFTNSDIEIDISTNVPIVFESFIDSTTMSPKNNINITIITATEEYITDSVSESTENSNAQINTEYSPDHLSSINNTTYTQLPTVAPENIFRDLNDNVNTLISSPTSLVSDIFTYTPSADDSSTENVILHFSTNNFVDDNTASVISKISTSQDNFIINVSVENDHLGNDHSTSTITLPDTSMASNEYDSATESFPEPNISNVSVENDLLANDHSTNSQALKEYDTATESIREKHIINVSVENDHLENDHSTGTITLPDTSMASNEYDSATESFPEPNIINVSVENDQLANDHSTNSLAFKEYDTATESIREKHIINVSVENDELANDISESNLTLHDNTMISEEYDTTTESLPKNYIINVSVENDQLLNDTSTASNEYETATDYMQNKDTRFSDVNEKDSSFTTNAQNIDEMQSTGIYDGTPQDVTTNTLNEHESEYNAISDGTTAYNYIIKSSNNDYSIVDATASNETTKITTNIIHYGSSISDNYGTTPLTSDTMSTDVLNYVTDTKSLDKVSNFSLVNLLELATTEDYEGTLMPDISSPETLNVTEILLGSVINSKDDLFEVDNSSSPIQENILTFSQTTDGIINSNSKENSGFTVNESITNSVMDSSSTTDGFFSFINNDNGYIMKEERFDFPEEPVLQITPEALPGNSDISLKEITKDIDITTPTTDNFHTFSEDFSTTNSKDLVTVLLNSNSIVDLIIDEQSGTTVLPHNNVNDSFNINNTSENPMINSIDSLGSTIIALSSDDISENVSLNASSDVMSTIKQNEGHIQDIIYSTTEKLSNNLPNQPQELVGNEIPKTTSTARPTSTVPPTPVKPVAHAMETWIILLIVCILSVIFLVGGIIIFLRIARRHNGHFQLSP